MTPSYYTLEMALDGHRELRVVALVDGLMVGTANVANYRSGVGTLFQVFVEETWRKAGVGRGMVERAEELVGRANGKAMSAVVMTGGPLGFWQRLGYEPAHIEADRMIVSKRLRGDYGR